MLYHISLIYDNLNVMPTSDKEKSECSTMGGGQSIPIWNLELLEFLKASTLIFPPCHLWQSTLANSVGLIDCRID